MHCYIKYILNYIIVLNKNKQNSLILYVVSKTGNNCVIISSFFNFTINQDTIKVFFLNLPKNNVYEAFNNIQCL